MARGRLRVFLVLILVLILACLSAPSVQRLYHLFRLPFVWTNSSAQAIISQQHDHFDVTFSSFPANYSTKEAGLPTLVPAKLHHIHLGPNPPAPEWLSARADCLKQHEGWEAFLWNDTNAPQFVEEHFPHLYDMWKGYPFMVQRVDALRYMALEKYGGMLPVVPDTNRAGLRLTMRIFSRCRSRLRLGLQALPRTSTSIRLCRAGGPPRGLLGWHDACLAQ